jgi:two-component system response regulator AtoC
MTDNNPIEMQRNTVSGIRTEVSVETRTGKVLIVDDEIEVLGLLHVCLEENGFTVTSTLSAGEALDLMLAESFDLLIADLDMPEINGIELLNEALEIAPDLIGIIMTGHGSIETAVNAMKAGAFDYLLKPFELKVLLPVLSRAMRVRHLSRSERRHRMLVDELTTTVKNLDATARQPEMNDVEMVELKEEIEDLKSELLTYRTMENQWMFYES